MQVLQLAVLLASISTVLGRGLEHIGIRKSDYVDVQRRFPQVYAVLNQSAPLEPRQPKLLNDKTKKFYVDGTKIPEVDFDIGESYAGLLPISKDPKETRQLYFWYFPSNNPLASNETTIWLNGGPGCSSLIGFLQENGPFLWQPGTFKPVPNPWTWQNLTNMLWVEQPVGTGFSQGQPNATSLAELSNQFKGFFRNFVDTFSAHNRKVYLTGESYAGSYIPSIASSMLDEKNKEYFDVEGTLIYDPTITSVDVSVQVPALSFVEYWNGLFPFNSTYLEKLREKDRKCGFTEFLNKHLTFPPKGKLPPSPQATDECDIANDIMTGINDINPCFDVYHVSQTCPLQWDVLSFINLGTPVYFNRTDVKKAINAPDVSWSGCAPKPVFATESGAASDDDDYTYITVLPSVIDRTKRNIIGHGLLDFVLVSNGTLLAIQNMTWGGKQGFQEPITEEFYVPLHDDLQASTQAASGVMGRTRTERNFTFVEINLAGHMVPEFQPSAAYRHLEYLLGRIPNLSSRVPFTKSDNGLKAEGQTPSQAAGGNRTEFSILFGKQADRLIKNKGSYNFKLPYLF